MSNEVEPEDDGNGCVYFARVRDGLGFSEGIGGKVKDPKRTGDAKLRAWFFKGFERSEELQRLVHKIVDADKDKDRYRELVVDPKTGTVLRDCLEPLSEHQGRGSAKFKAPENPAMRMLLEQIKSGKTFFSPDSEGMTLDAFQGVVRELKRLRQRGLVGPMEMPLSMRLESRYRQVIFVSIRDGLTEAGKRYLGEG